jgi:hypothetical protein
LRALSDIHNVDAQLALTVRDHSVELRDLNVRSGPLSAQGNLTLLKDGGRSQPYGALLVSVGSLEVGIDLQGKKSKAILFNADRWFEARRRERSEHYLR